MLEYSFCVNLKGKFEPRYDPSVKGLTTAHGAASGMGPTATVGAGTNGGHVNGRSATGIGGGGNGGGAAVTVIGGPGPPSKDTPNGEFTTSSN